MEKLCNIPLINGLSVDEVFINGGYRIILTPDFA